MALNDDALAAVTELADQGVPTPGVSGPPALAAAPSPAASSVPAATPAAAPTVAMMPHPTPGMDWRSIMQLIAPVVGEALSGGVHGHFLNGFMQGQQLADEHQRQDRQDQERRDQAKANFLLGLTEHAQTLDDPADFANLMHVAQMAGEKAGYLKPGETIPISFSPTKLQAKRLKEIDDQLSSYERVGYNLDDLAAAGASLTLKDGRQIPIAAAVDMTRRRPTAGFTPPSNAPGMIQSGNIDLANRPRVKNPDGSVSTVRSISINEDGKEILIPTVSDDGRVLSDEDAIALYHRTGKNLGTFVNAAAATAYAQRLHDSYASAGQPISRPKSADIAQKTEEERFLDKWAKDRGKKVSDLSSADELEARKAFRAAGRMEPTGPKSDTGQQLEDLVSVWKEAHPGQEPPAAVRAQLRAKAARDLAEARSVAQGQQAGLDPEGLEFAATQYRVTGVMPALGQRSNADRTAVVNTAAKQAKTLGQSPAGAIQKQAAYKADASALTQMKKMSSAAESYESKASAQADIISELSARVPRTSWPIINDALLAGKKEIAGDKNTQLLYNAVQTFTNEYAKIMEGSTGSAAASSDAARKAAERLIRPGLNQKTLQSTLDLMKREMQLTLDGYSATVDHITNRMGGAVDTGSSTPPAAAPGAVPTYQDYLRQNGLQTNGGGRGRGPGGD